MQYYLQLNNPGSGNLSVHRYSPGTADLTIGKLIKVNYRGQERGGWFIENISYDEVKSGERAGEWKNVTGRGAMAVLADGIVYPEIGSAETTRVFTNVTMASILLTFIAEAKARGCFPDLRTDFSATLDSNGEPWTDLSTLTFNVDTNLLDVITQFVDLGLEFDFQLDWIVGDYVLYAYQTAIGSDVSASVVFRPGLNCAEVSNKQESGELKNALRISYGGGTTEITDAASIAAYRRREAPFQAGNVTTSGGAVQMATPELTAKKDPQLSISIKVEDAAGNPRAFVDYKVGDWVGYDAGDGAAPALYRVRGMMLDFGENDKYAVITVDLNSIRLERELQNAVALRKLGNGVIGASTSSPMPEGLAAAISAHNTDNTSHATRTLSGGDLSGTIGIPTVAKLRGRALKNPLTLSDKHLLKWSHANQQFEPGYLEWDEIENKPSVTDSLVTSLYLMAAFNEDDDNSLYLLYSKDGITWNDFPKKPVYQEATIGIRDPGICYYHGKWYVSYTDTNAPYYQFKIIESSDLINWSLLVTLDARSMGQASATLAWAPEWFIDDADDSVHLFLSVSDSDHLGMHLFETHPTNAGWTTWSNLLQITGTSFPSAMIDPFIVKIGSIYYLWYKDEVTLHIEYATSTSLTSGYTTIESGDWAGWGDHREGESLVQVSANLWRIYYDHYVQNGLYYSESDDLFDTWSTPALITTPDVMSHPTVLMVRDLAALSDVLAAINLPPFDGVNYGVKDGVHTEITGGGSPSVTNAAYGAVAKRTTTQAVATATPTAISFNSEVRDDGGFYSSANPTRFTAVVDGWCVFSGTCHWAGANSYGRRLYARLNGTTEISGTSVISDADHNDPRQNVTGVYYLSSGDYIEFMLDQNSGRTINIQANSYGGIALILNGIADAPSDGTEYVRKDAGWVENSGGSGGATVFTDLTDVPAAYTDEGGKLVRVNAAEDGLEFVAPSAGDGDVVGPASAADNHLALFSGITGKLIKDGGALDIGAGHITILPLSYVSIGQGDWTISINASSYYSSYLSQATPANLDNISYNAFLAVGTYSLVLYYHKNTTGGIMDIDIDSVEVGSVDQYSASLTWNLRYLITNINIATAGLKEIKLRMDGKHASSSNYKGWCTYLALWRTA